jgi:hypothetical protein
MYSSGRVKRSTVGKEELKENGNSDYDTHKELLDLLGEGCCVAISFPF